MSCLGKAPNPKLPAPESGKAPETISKLLSLDVSLELGDGSLALPFGFACRNGGHNVVGAMKLRLLFSLLLAALVADGSAKAASAGSPRVVEITANDTMKFSLTTIEAKAGEQIKLVLKNLGTLPKEAMGHNWVLLKAGSDAGAFSAAAITAKDKDYIPDSKKDEVIAHTALLGAKKSDEVVFTVPPAGEYPFLCSFPAHFAVGMKGTLISK